MSTPIDFSTYVMNNLKIDNLTQEHLVGPAFNLLKGQEYLFDLSKPLLLIEDRGRQVVPVNYFINNDLEYLKGGSLSRKYTTSTTKTKAAKYDDIQGIEDMVPSVSKNDVFSTKRIIAVTHVKVMKWYDYGYLEEIEVQRDDQKLYKFKEGVLSFLSRWKTFNWESKATRRSSISLGRRHSDYLPKRRWRTLDKQRSRIMIKAIDKLQLERRLMRNLEKFIGGREYGEDFRLLEQTI
ncbi:hypothetical protein Tco_0033719 [Tanacetum coccineum]